MSDREELDDLIDVECIEFYFTDLILDLCANRCAGKRIRLDKVDMMVG